MGQSSGCETAFGELHDAAPCERFVDVLQRVENSSTTRKNELASHRGKELFPNNAKVKGFA
jgi:hypothetical protein